MKKLCVCIPTCDRPEAVARVLKEEVNFLKKRNVDLIIFDSSNNDKTKELVCRYIESGYSNVLIERMDSYISSNEKVFRIYEKMTEPVYEYIWMIHDHTICDENALNYVLKQLEKGACFYLLKMQERDFYTNKICGLDDFLVRGAWSLNSFGTAIIKRSSFLQGIDWKTMNDKWLCAERLNYAHIGLYFERMSEIENPFVMEIGFPRECFIDFMRYKRPSWDREAVRICTECWGSVLMSLPDCYTKKEMALTTQDKWFMSKYNLLTYKKSGLFDLRKFIQYKQWMRRIMPENYKNAFWISVLPYHLAKFRYCSGLLYQIEKYRKKGKKICLYGAGRHAFECFIYLQDMNVKPDCCLVSNTDGNPKEIDGCPVKRAEEYLKDNSVFILIAVLTSGVSEVERYLDFLITQGADVVYTEFK